MVYAFSAGRLDMTEPALNPPCACPECSAFGRDTHTEQQGWWHDEPVDPHAGLGFLRMALWLLILIPLSEAWTAFRNWRKN